MKALLFSLLLFIVSFYKVSAQCSSGELLRNPSFENNTGCTSSANFSTGAPNTFIQTLTDWVQANGASPDYYTCGSTQFSQTGTAGYDPPLPYPNGTGYIGMLNWNPSIQVTEPFGQCLTTPLVSGQTYTFRFKMTGSTTCSSAPITIGIWGTTNCAGINDASYLCPTNGGLTLLGLSGLLITNTTNWLSASITFVAPSNIAAIVIGGNCTYPAPSPTCGAYGGGDTYYYFDDLSLTGPPASVPSVTASISTNVSCAGASTGSVSSSPSGGTGGYSYAWSNGGTGASISGVPAGTYNVTITDGNGCSAGSNTVTVSQPASAPSVSVSTSANVGCAGASTGSVSSSPSGGTGGYSYAWSNGGTGASISGVPAGTYNVTITDGNGCSAGSNTVTVSEPSAALAATASVTTNVTTFGGSDGSASVSVAGGTTGYTYAWSNGGTGASITGLPVGSYSVAVTDANGCFITSNTIIITDPNTPLSASITSSSNVTCTGANNGSASVSAVGGAPGYTYAWSNGATTQNINGLATGTYSVTVTDANSNVVTTSSVTISEPSAALTATATNTANVTTTGGSDGSASVSVAGGTMPYYYSWTNTGTGAPLSSTTSTITNVPAGNYNVTVTDSNSCLVFSNTVSITEPLGAILSATANVTSNVSCAGGANGTATATVVGGTAGYTYAWSNGATTPTITGLTAGTYSVTVTDASTAVVTSNTVTITAPSTALAVSTSASTNVNCYGASTGSASVSVAGGTTPYYYSWSNGATTPSINGLTAGNYTVTVTDSNNCLSLNNITITAPSGGISVSTTNVTSAICSASNGSATLIVNSGTPFTYGYNYLWDNGNTSNAVNNLTVGMHTVIVTDSLGCSTTDSVLITNTITNLAVDILGTKDTILCQTGTLPVTASLSNGTAPYTYYLNNGTNITGGNNFAQNITITNDTIVIITVSDASGCASNVGDTLRIKLVQPMNSGLASDTTLCERTTLLLAPLTTSGKPPYTYLWNGATPSNSSTLQVAPTANTTYYLTITDACNNTSTDSINIKLTPKPTANFSYEGLVPLTQGIYNFKDSSTGQGIVKWYWTFGDEKTASLQNPSHQYNATGSFSTTLIIQNNLGCIDSVTKLIIGQKDTIIVPTVFTPNGDGVNDVFSIASSSVSYLKLAVYNRWGLLLFNAEGIKAITWDATTLAGTKVTDGTYYYMLNITTLSNKQLEQKGFIQVVR